MRSRSLPCCALLMAARSGVPTGPIAVDGLSSPPEMKTRRPLVSLTGPGDVSGFLYGKLQRATSIYGSGLVGPATAVVHGYKDVSELLPPGVVGDTGKDPLGDLDRVLWNQFGMASCEGSVEREDLLTEMSFLKPRLADLRDTLLFLDATTAGAGSANKSGGGGLGGLFASMLPKREPSDRGDEGPDCWLDADLVRSAVARGSTVFVACENEDSIYCAEALGRCLPAAGGDAGEGVVAAAVTLVCPDDGVVLGGTGDGDSRWKSSRPQDLEGELSRAVAVRDASDDAPDGRGADAGDGGDRAGTGPPLSRRDLAEVCVQCALRLPPATGQPRLRVVKVAPRGGGGDDGRPSDGVVERPNRDYFSMMGGKEAKARAGVVASVDWVVTLAPLLASSEGQSAAGTVREFPRRPGT